MPPTLEDLERTPMDRDEMAAMLESEGVGTLSMADEGTAYGLPMSFGYRGDGRLYFMFLRGGEGGRKERFVEAGGEASFLVYDVGSHHQWRSVIASGPIRPVRDDESEALQSALENAWYPDLFSASVPTRGVSGYVLEIEELTGYEASVPGKS